MSVRGGKTAARTPGSRRRPPDRRVLRGGKTLRASRSHTAGAVLPAAAGDRQAPRSWPAGDTTIAACPWGGSVWCGRRLLREKGLSALAVVFPRCGFQTWQPRQVEIHFPSGLVGSSPQIRSIARISDWRLATPPNRSPESVITLHRQSKLKRHRSRDLRILRACLSSLSSLGMTNRTSRPS